MTVWMAPAGLSHEVGVFCRGRSVRSVPFNYTPAVPGVGVDGVARGHGEIWRQLIEAEPADLVRFSWLIVYGFA